MHYSFLGVSGNGMVALRGARRLGIEMRVGPVAIPNGRFGNRPHCIYRGFCIQGCKVGAKQSTLYSHVPDAIEHGAEIRADSMVFRISLDSEGRARSVHYLDVDGREREQRPGAAQQGDMVAPGGDAHRAVDVHIGQLQHRVDRALQDVLRGGARRRRFKLADLPFPAHPAGAPRYRSDRNFYDDSDLE